MEKRPLVICTDPGIDDFIALSMVLSRPEFDVLGMVALSGNVGLDVTVNNALLACEYNARADIPVLAGSAKPLVRPVRSASNIHGKSGLGASLELYAKGTPSDKNGADFIIEQAKAHAGKLEILSLGPLTDVALALEKAPASRDRPRRSRRGSSCRRCYGPACKRPRSWITLQERFFQARSARAEAQCPNAAGSRGSSHRVRS